MALDPDGSVQRTGVQSHALEQLAGGLYASLDTYNADQDNDPEAAESVRRAHNYMNDAAGHAALLADLLEMAQCAIDHPRLRDSEDRK